MGQTKNSSKFDQIESFMQARAYSKSPLCQNATKGDDFAHCETLRGRAQ